MSSVKPQDIQPRNHGALYFGKIPAQADFVKSSNGAKVIARIDAWVEQGMNLLIADADWKARYDDAAPLDFLFVGTHLRQAICGSLAPSRDASSRRFPFIAANSFEIDTPLDFIALSPLILRRNWTRLRALVLHAISGNNAAEQLRLLDKPACEYDDAEHALEAYATFLEDTTLGRLESNARITHPDLLMRQTVLALGFLLQPLLAGGSEVPLKALAVPVSGDPATAAFMRAFWLDLVATFLLRGEFELGIFNGMLDGRSYLVLSFSGAVPQTFSSLVGSDASSAHVVDTKDAPWVEDYIENDYGVKKLASYLDHPDLSLRQMIETFREVFAGL